MAELAEQGESGGVTELVEPGESGGVAELVEQGEREGISEAVNKCSAFVRWTVLEAPTSTTGQVLSGTCSISSSSSSM